MANLKQLPPETVRSLVRQIGDRIDEEFTSSAAAVPPAPINGVEQPLDFWPLAGIDRAQARFELGETFEVWTLRDDAARHLSSTREDLVTLARDTGAYRHLVKRTDGGRRQALAYAQSYARGGVEKNDREVRDFYFSPLAELLDKAIDAADRQVPEKVVTRILSVAEFKVEALWFVTLAAPKDKEGPHTARTHGVIVAAAPASFHAKTLSLMDSPTFIRALSRTTRGMGLRL